MLLYITSRVFSSIAAFLYPGYASYKTLSKRPASEEDIERWLMYWAVLGCLVGVELVAEWLVSWIPLYYLMKTFFLLYLALPQTCGSTYLYKAHLQPFFTTHENQIDAALATIKARVYSFVQERLRALWEHVAATLGPPPLDAQPTAVNAPPPSTSVSGPVHLLTGLWHTHGPSIIAAGAALLRQPAAAPSHAAADTHAHARSNTAQSIIERRRQLEAELASLPPIASGTESPVLEASSTSVTSRASLPSGLRVRTVDGGRFEEIEMPTELEGYDISGIGDDIGHEDGSRPGGGGYRRTSWFGWGGGSHENVKND